MEDKVHLCFGARIGSVWWFSEQFPVNSCSANECANLMSCAELFANCLKLSHLLWSAWTNLFQKTFMWYVEITRLEAPIDIVWKTFCCASWNVDFNFQPNFLFLYFFFVILIGLFFLVRKILILLSAQGIFLIIQRCKCFQLEWQIIKARWNFQFKQSADKCSQTLLRN